MSPVYLTCMSGLWEETSDTENTKLTQKGASATLARNQIQDLVFVRKQHQKILAHRAVPQFFLEL